MNIWNYILDSRRTIMANKLRSWLSSLGIIIGVSSVVILLSIGAWFKQELAESMGEMAANNITLNNYNNSKTKKSTKSLSFNTGTITFLETTFSELSGRVYGTTNLNADKIIYNSKSLNHDLRGVSLNYFSNIKKKIEHGGSFSAEDREKKSNVIILSYNALEKLFDNESPIGKTVRIKGKLFTVVGVLEKSSQDSRMWDYIESYIPFSTAVERFGSKKEYEQITINLPTTADNEQWRQMIYYALIRYVGANTKDEVKFSVSSFASYIKEREKTINGFSIFLGIIGGISLLVGGIGVMNIMIVSVTERTREIGIRKAIGALRRDIITQFLIESILITFLGGIIAILLSRGIVALLNTLLWKGGGGRFEGLKLTITSDVLVMAVGLTVCTGIIFGILPARKAMRLKPIDALRFE